MSFVFESENSFETVDARSEGWLKIKSIEVIVIENQCDIKTYCNNESNIKLLLRKRNNVNHDITNIQDFHLLERVLVAS